MGASTVTDSSLLDSIETELRILLGEHRCNVLFEGSVAATDAVLRLLQPNLRKPIQRHRPHAPLDLSRGDVGTLILRDAAALGAAEQRLLLDWIDGPGSRAQIISTTRRPLFALVTAGSFDAALYYRLNVMLFHIGAPHSARLPWHDAERAPAASASATTLEER